MYLLAFLINKGVPSPTEHQPLEGEPPSSEMRTGNHQLEPQPGALFLLQGPQSAERDRPGEPR